MKKYSIESAEDITIILDKPCKNDHYTGKRRHLGLRKASEYCIEDIVAKLSEGGELYELPLIGPQGSSFRVFKYQPTRKDKKTVIKIPRREMYAGGLPYDSEEKLNADKEFWNTIKRQIITAEYIDTIWPEGLVWKSGRPIRIDQFSWEGDENLSHKPFKNNEYEIYKALGKVIEDTLKVYENDGIILDIKLANWCVGVDKNHDKYPFVDLDTLATFERENYSKKSKDMTNLGKRIATTCQNMWSNHHFKFQEMNLADTIEKNTLNSIERIVSDNSDRTAIKSAFKSEYNKLIKTSIKGR